MGVGALRILCFACAMNWVILMLLINIASSYFITMQVEIVLTVALT